MIDSIGFSLQSAVTLYIYRVGKTYPARNPVYRSKSIKNSNCTRTPPRPVRPVGPTDQTGRTYRSDRLVMPNRLQTPRPVRPPGHTGQTGLYRLLPILVVNICPPVFLVKLACQKNILLNQNFLRAMIRNASAIYYL